jgi:catechol 2,3-dioxygenase-like lactoylglutathione lyase family enzyme
LAVGSITHGAICTKNNRRLARFYHLVFGLDEVWNPVQNSPYSFYMGDGAFQLNVLQIRSGSSYAKIVDGREVLPDPGIHHIGFQVKDLKQAEKHFAELDPPVTLTASPGDGRYEERRFTDPDGNLFELAEAGWDAGPARSTLPLVRHVSLCSPNPDRLAAFYKAALGMKELCRAEVGEARSPAVFLSDGVMSFEIINDAAFGKRGLRSIGFQVASIDEIRSRIKNAPPFLYPGEPPITLADTAGPYPYKTSCLRDPDGNLVLLTDEGWGA